MTVHSRGAQRPKDLPRVISPELRRRLQERYARAQSLMARPKYDFGEVHRLVAENLCLDPGNLRYIDLLLLNLKRRRAARVHPGWFNRLVGATPLGARAALERALAAGDLPQAVRLVPDALWSEGLEADGLTLAAQTCGELQLGRAELRYRQAAVEVDPESPEPVRQVARALMRAGQYDDARDWWLRVIGLRPDDAEAAAAIGLGQSAAATTEEADLRKQISANPADIGALLKLAGSRMVAADFEEARKLLLQASAVGGGDLRVREAWETHSLSESENRLRLAREAAEREASDQAMQLAATLEAEHDRLVLGIAHSRAERFPRDGQLKLELARLLKRSGNYSGAVQRLDELRLIAGYEQVALVELGECWQHLRQFGKALDFYRAAIQERPSDEDLEVRRLALYRGAVLAEALGHLAEACTWLESLISSAGQYKDARERLDKLRPICDKNGFYAG